MGIALPRFAKVDRGFEYGISAAAINAFRGSASVADVQTDPACDEFYERIEFHGTEPVLLTGTLFEVIVYGAATCTLAGVEIVSVPTGESVTGANGVVVAASPNLAATPLAEGNHAVSWYNLLSGLTFTPDATKDYYVHWYAYKPTTAGASAVYLKSTAIATTPGSTNYYHHGAGVTGPVFPPTGTGAHTSGRYACMGRVMFRTANCVQQVIAGTSVGAAGKIYLYPQCVSHPQHIIIGDCLSTPAQAGSRVNSAAAINFALKTLAADGTTLTLCADWGVDFTDAAKNGVISYDGTDYTWTLGAAEVNSDYFAMAMMRSVAGFFDLMFANLTHVGLAAQGAGDRLFYSGAQACGDIASPMGAHIAEGNLNLMDFLVIGGASAATFGEITICTQPLVVLGDSEPSVLTKNLIGNYFAPTRGVLDATISGNHLTETALTYHTMGLQRFCDLSGVYGRLNEVVDSVFVLMFGVNDIGNIGGSGDAGTLSMFQWVYKFVGAVASIIGEVKGVTARGNEIVVVGPFATVAPAANSAAQVAAVRLLNTLLSDLCARTRTPYVNMLNFVPGEADGIHISNAQSPTVSAAIAAAYEAGLTPPLAGGGDVYVF